MEYASLAESVHAAIGRATDAMTGRHPDIPLATLILGSLQGQLKANLPIGTDPPPAEDVVLKTMASQLLKLKAQVDALTIAVNGNVEGAEPADTGVSNEGKSSQAETSPDTIHQIIEGAVIRLVAPAFHGSDQQRHRLLLELPNTAKAALRFVLDVAPGWLPGVPRDKVFTSVRDAILEGVHSMSQRLGLDGDAATALLAPVARAMDELKPANAAGAANANANAEAEANASAPTEGEK